jgi:Ca-activated chloride channel family protein
MTRRGLAALALSAVLAPPPPVGATPGCTEDAMLVFDGSGSMSEAGFNEMNEPRIFEARAAVRRAIPRVAAQRDLGLIVYGPGAEAGPGACANIDLRFRPRPDAAPHVIAAVETLIPDGETPLTEAVALAARVLDHRNRPGVIVLLTDGKETCDGAPCQLAAALAAEGMDLTVHVIGFKVRDKFFTWGSQASGGSAGAQTVARCLADRTGGKYYGPETAEALAEALDDALGCPVIGRRADFAPAPL